VRDSKHTVTELGIEATELGNLKKAGLKVTTEFWNTTTKLRGDVMEFGILRKGLKSHGQVCGRFATVLGSVAVNAGWNYINAALNCVNEVWKRDRGVWK